MVICKVVAKRELTGSLFHISSICRQVKVDYYRPSLSLILTYKLLFSFTFFTVDDNFDSVSQSGSTVRHLLKYFLCFRCLT